MALFIAEAVIPDAEREWAAYVRVSKVNGRSAESGYVSPRQQEAAIRLGLSVQCGQGVVPADDRVYIDEDRTGRDDDRPGFQAMLQWVYEAPARRGIAVMDGSRLFRNTAEFLNTIKTLEALGARYLSVYEAVDPATPEGTLMHTLLAGMSQYQSDAIGRRWRMTQKGRIEQGLPAGGGPRFGYYAPWIEDENGTSRRSRVYVPHPETAPILRSMYEDYVEGVGLQGIARRLNDLGHRSPRGLEWNLTSISRTLDSGFGAGLILVGDYETRVKKDPDGKPVMVNGRPLTYKERVNVRHVEGRHEPVITAEQWERYRAAREQRRLQSSRNQRPRWYLRGVAKCGLCGTSLSLASHSDKKALATCTRYKTSRTCTGVWMNRNSIDRAVAWWLANRLYDVAGETASERQRQRARRRAEERIAEAEQRLAALSRERVGNVRSHNRGDLSDQEYATAKSENEAETDSVTIDLLQARETLDRSAPSAEVFDALIQLGRSQLRAADTNSSDEVANPPRSDEDQADEAARYRALLLQVVTRVEITKHEVTIVPVVGEPASIPRL